MPSKDWAPKLLGEFSLLRLNPRMFHRSTIQLLRFHFSFFLLPVYLFAVAESPTINWTKALWIFIILHLLVYPSSNGYNSYMDRDTSPIGGLYTPLKPTKQLFYVSVMMDITALIASFFMSLGFALGILLYILASRAYSFRGIRLKKYPITGFLVVFFCQGGLIYICTFLAVSGRPMQELLLISPLVASTLIGALYPLTQIYQHDADRQDGVQTISMLLGTKGSFLFSMVLFITSSFLLGWSFFLQNHMNYFYIFLLIMLPVVLFFLYWMHQAWRDQNQANFRNSFIMSFISTLCSISFFITLLILNH